MKDTAVRRYLSPRQRKKPTRYISKYLVYLGLSLCLLLNIFIAGCSSSGTEKQALQGHLLIVGGSTIEPFLTIAASRFHEQNPQVQIEVQGKGSVVGLQALADHKADLAMSSIYADPALYPSEVDHLICILPGTIVVNSTVPITSLTYEQLIGIFSSGTIHNWSELGGPDLPITPLMRADSSGLRVLFHKYVLQGGKEYGKILTVNSDTDMRTSIAQTPGAIGYLGLPNLNNTVRPVAIDGTSPTAQAIRENHYAFWGYGHLYSGDSTTPLAHAFLDFMQTDPIQQEAQRIGYLPANTADTPNK